MKPPFGLYRVVFDVAQPGDRMGVDFNATPWMEWTVLAASAQRAIDTAIAQARDGNIGPKETLVVRDCSFLWKVDVY